MGMDLITSMLVTEAGSEPDWDAGIMAIETLTEDDVDLSWLENFGLVEFDDDDNVDMSEVRNGIKGALEDVRYHIEVHSRNLNVWELWGHKMFVFGCESWGDVDEVIDSIGIIDVCPKVMEAVGFVTDFTGKVVKA